MLLICFFTLLKKRGSELSVEVREGRMESDDTFVIGADTYGSTPFPLVGTGFRSQVDVRLTSAPVKSIHKTTDRTSFSSRL